VGGASPVGGARSRRTEQRQRAMRGHREKGEQSRKFVVPARLRSMVLHTNFFLGQHYMR
jgi:hypothetical protein